MTPAPSRPIRPSTGPNSTTCGEALRKDEVPAGFRVLNDLGGIEREERAAAPGEQVRVFARECIPRGELRGARHALVDEQQIRERDRLVIEIRLAVMCGVREEQAAEL